jgi:hypothetical protein
MDDPKKPELGLGESCEPLPTKLCGLCGTRKGVLYQHVQGGVCCDWCRAANNWPKDELTIVQDVPPVNVPDELWSEHRKECICLDEPAFLPENQCCFAKLARLIVEPSVPAEIESRLSEIQERLHESTGEQWIPVEGHESDDWGVTEAGTEGQSIAQMCWESDAKFIAHAKSDIAYLLAALADSSPTQEKPSK